MTRRILVVVVGGASAAAVFTVATALAAYSSPRLEVTQAGSRVTLDVAQSAGDDATAIARIISPIGTRIAPAQAAGTTVGTATARFIAMAAGDAPVAATGRLVVVAPASSTAECTVGERVEGHLSLDLTGPGLSLQVPVYVLVGGDLLLCLAHPDTLAGGAKLVSLQLTLDGPLEIPRSGTWISIWVPYGAGNLPDASRIVASPAIVGGGSVTFTARAKGAGAVIVGFVRQAGAPRADARIRITGGGASAASQRLLGTPRTNRGGQFTFHAKSGTFFRATATVPRSSPPGLCFVLEPFLRPIPCVNPTLNGFSVQSRTIRKR